MKIGYIGKQNSFARSGAHYNQMTITALVFMTCRKVVFFVRSDDYREIGPAAPMTAGRCQ
jgi:hypothetical protein